MSEYLEFAKSLAYQAGDIMLAYFKVGVDNQLKADKSPVTEADIKINDLVIKAVNSKYPEHSILGEEASHIKEGSQYVWVCDPIDGTIPFTHGIPTNMFSLALVKDGEPTLGVLYDPYMERLYSAEKNNGAFLNETAIVVNNKRDPNELRVGLSSPPRSRSFCDMGRLQANLYKKGIRFFYFGSTTYETALVASGQITASIFSGKTAHDIAAAKIIVEEAGGKVTDLQGNEQRYDKPINGAIVSNGEAHKALLELIHSQ